MDFFSHNDRWYRLPKYRTFLLHHPVFMNNIDQLLFIMKTDYVLCHVLLLLILDMQVTKRINLSSKAL